MTPRQILVISILSLSLLVVILELIRRHFLREKYSLAWLFIGFTSVSIPWFYDYYQSLGRFLGIVNPTSFFFFFAIFGLLLLSLQFSLALTSAYMHRKALTQHLGILEARVRELEAQTKNLKK